MKVKGSSLTSTYNFVKNTFPDRVEEWIRALPINSIELYTKTILASNWYSFEDGLIQPTKTIANLFYNGDEKKASYDIGMYSAGEGLKGVYKIFIKIATPLYVLKRSVSIFKTYYDKIDVEIIESNDKYAQFYIKGFKADEQLIFDRISGWIFKVMEIIKAKPQEIKFITIPVGEDLIEAKIMARWI